MNKIFIPSKTRGILVLSSREKLKEKMALALEDKAIERSSSGLILFAISALFFTLFQLYTILFPNFERESLPPKKVENNWKTYPKHGQDNQQRYAKFLFVALSDKFSWKKSKTSILLYKKEPLGEKGFIKVVFNDLSELIKRSGGLVTIGTSSQEGELVEEEERALKRGQQLANWIQPKLPAKKGLYTLSLGQYNKKCKGCNRHKTSYQRPALLVCILDWEKGVNMGQALASAMKQLRELPNPDNYSAFIFQTIQKINVQPQSESSGWPASIGKLFKNLKFKIFG